MLGLIAAGCRIPSPTTRPALEDEGIVYVYLDAYPQEAERMTFAFAALAAVREDGSTVPLSLRLGKVSGKDLRRERLLATGEVPAGRYAGLWVQARDASLRSESGATSPRLDDEGTRVAVPFHVPKKRGVVVSLQFLYRESVADGFQFSPQFAGTLPSKIAPGRIGCATSRDANLVTTFDKVSGQVVGILPTGRGPAGIVVDPLRFRAYLAISGDDAIEEIDLLENSIGSRLQLTGGDAPEDLALTPDGRTLLVVNSGSNTVSLVDTSGLVERSRVSVGNAPASVLIDSNGRRAYVFNALSDTISILDLPGGSLLATIATDAGPVRGQLDREGGRLFVVHRSSPYLAVVDTASWTVLRRVRVGTASTALKVDPRTNRIYVARRNADTVDVYDPLSLLPVDSLRAEGEVAFLAIDGEERNLCLVLSGAGKLRMVRLVSKKTVAETDLGEGPGWVAFMGER